MKKEIIINGKKLDFEPDLITHEEIVNLAFEKSQNILYTVTWMTRLDGHELSDTLAPGESVPVDPGMIFNVDVDVSYSA